jgi:hypothetical protein
VNFVRQLLVSVLAFAPATAFAQPAEVELSDAQVAYNERGVEYVAEGEYELAAQKFRASLAIGEANVTMLNLGRTLARMGRCKEARQTYDRVSDAPAVASPTPEEIAGVLDKYRSELPDPCPSVLAVTCPDGATGVVVDGGTPVTCEAAATLEVEPGKHTVEAVGVQASAEVEVPAEEWLEVELERTVVVTENSEPDTTVSTGVTVEKRGMSGLQTAGLVLAGVGGAAVVTGAILDGAWVQPAVAEYDDADAGSDLDALYDDATTRQTVNKVVILGGAGLAVTGGVLWLLGRQPADSTVAVGFSGDAASVSVQGRFY